MLRRIVCLLGAACMVLWVAVPAHAAENRGVITVIPQWNNSPLTGGTVALYRVGSVVAEGFQLTDGLANWTVQEEERTSSILLNWLEGNVKKGLMIPAGEDGACFSGLREGVYLIRQTEAPEGYQKFSPLLVQLPDSDNWEIIVRPQVIRDTEIPETGDHPAPIIGAMGIGLSAAVLMVLVDERKK